jgi:hypothetical protein
MKYVTAVLLLLVATMSAQNAPTMNKEGRLDIPTISREANGAVVSIVMSDKKGHPIAQGSGFLTSKDGRIVTNYHVIKSGSSAVVKLPNGTIFPVEGVLASDKHRDVAIIKAHGSDFRTLALGDSDRLQVGEEVVAIGNPLSLESTVSNGIVSGIRTVEEEGGKFLQITAPISPGSSGGPLFNMAGQVVGITTSHLVGGENLNFAIPIDDVKYLTLVPRLAEAHALPDEAEGAEIQSNSPSPKVGQPKLAYERHADSEGRAHYSFKADCSVVGNLEGCLIFNELAGNEDSEVFKSLLSYWESVVCFEDPTSVQADPNVAGAIRRNLTHAKKNYTFYFSFWPSNLKGILLSQSNGTDTKIWTFDLMPLTDHYRVDHDVPSTDDFLFKENREDGDIWFQKRGGLTKETLEFHRLMQVGSSWRDDETFEINLLTGRMTHAWAMATSRGGQPPVIYGRCFSTTLPERVVENRKRASQ